MTWFAAAMHRRVSCGTLRNVWDISAPYTSKKHVPQDIQGFDNEATAGEDAAHAPGNHCDG